MLLYVICIFYRSVCYAAALENNKEILYQSDMFD